MRCNLTVNTQTSYLNTDIVFKCDSQSFRLKDYLTGQEYYVNIKSFEIKRNYFLTKDCRIRSSCHARGRQ